MTARVAPRPCHECGYDLRGQDREGVCPECGRPVILSLGRTLATAGIGPLRLLAGGLAADAAELVVVAMPAVVALIGAQLDWSWGTLAWIGRGSWLVLALAGVAQAWCYALLYRAVRPPIGHAELSPLRRASRRGVLLLATAASLGAAAMVAVVVMPWTSTAAVIVAALVVPLVSARHAVARRGLEAVLPFDGADGLSVDAAEPHVIKFVVEITTLPLLVPLAATSSLDGAGLGCCVAFVGVIGLLVWLGMCIPQAVACGRELVRVRHALRIATT